jgi:hypothetical protein
MSFTDKKKTKSQDDNRNTTATATKPQFHTSAPNRNISWRVDICSRRPNLILVCPTNPQVSASRGKGLFRGPPDTRRAARRSASRSSSWTHFCSSWTDAVLPLSRSARCRHRSARRGLVIFLVILLVILLVVDASVLVGLRFGDAVLPRAGRRSARRSARSFARRSARRGR